MTTFFLSSARSQGARLARLFKAFGALALAVGAAIALLGAPAPSMAAIADDLDEAVGALRAIQTMRANFIQTDRNGQTLTGVMTLKRPGKVRFEYQKGANLLIVSNGKSLYMIDYEVNQLQRWPIKNSPLGALLDPDRDIQRYGRLIPTGNRDVLSVEVRDPDHPEYGRITMIFARNAAAPGGWQLASWVALDSQNNRTTVRLRNHRYGIAVSDKLFRFRDPRRTTRRPR